MKVHQLIESLQKFAPDAEVWIEPCTPECLGDAPISSVWSDEVDGEVTVQLSRAKTD